MKLFFVWVHSATMDHHPFSLRRTHRNAIEYLSITQDVTVNEKIAAVYAVNGQNNNSSATQMIVKFVFRSPKDHPCWLTHDKYESIWV